MNYWQTTLLILTSLYASLALAGDFKTIGGKEYKDASVIRVEPDGIMVKTKSAITKTSLNCRKRFGSALTTMRRTRLHSLPSKLLLPP
ncbi:MAG: hypothetical protein DME58_05380 [Verrucomicrobia bacterium]|nr:MAG: hypothetical protein DME58_05380 [Verrucomicrobiota bacterium]